ncbi:MAG: DUF2953 domain-containing protein [Firmicutes bacterium]|nr:DUF2953 domain-containing protein [Bacillota bacterium]
MSSYLRLGLALLIAGLFFIPFRLVVNYRLIFGDGVLRVKFLWLGIDLSPLLDPVVRRSKEPFSVQLRRWGKHKHKDGKGIDMLLIRRALGYFRATGHFFVGRIEKLHWQVTIGLGDAALTAIASGVLCGINGFGSSLLQSRWEMKREGIHWQVVPSYTDRRLDVEIDCILKLNVGHIMIAGAVNLVRVGFAKGVDFIERRL